MPRKRLTPQCPWCKQRHWPHFAGQRMDELTHRINQRTTRRHDQAVLETVVKAAKAVRSA